MERRPLADRTGDVCGDDVAESGDTDDSRRTEYDETGAAGAVANADLILLNGLEVRMLERVEVRMLID